MKYLLPTLTLMTACGGYVKEDQVVTVKSNNQPADVHRRTLERSSVDGIFASEQHKYKAHIYDIIALHTGTLFFVVRRTDTSTPTNHYLIDQVNTNHLEFPPNDLVKDQLYRLLLWEQKESLNDNSEGAKKVSELTDFVLKGLER